MSVPDIRLRIAHLVVHGDVERPITASATDLAGAIGDAIRGRLTGVPSSQGAGGFADAVAGALLKHPQIAGQSARSRGVR
jgi:hypothetical protein